MCQVKYQEILYICLDSEVKSNVNRSYIYLDSVSSQ